MNKIIGYVRVSTLEQREEGISLEAQQHKINAYCTVKDWLLTEVIIDDGISAKNLNRPGIEILISKVYAKEIKTVVVCKLDRLTRSVADLNKLLELFNKYDVALVSLAESLDATTATGRLMMNLLASVSQWEREIIGERTKEAISFLKEQEKIYSRPVFGYIENNGVMEKDLEDEKTLKLIKELKKQGCSYRKIAGELNYREVKTKRSGRWHANTIRRILINQEVD